MFSSAKGGLAVRLKVSARAARARIDGLVDDGGETRLKLAVSAPPVGGKANAAVIALLAKAWSVPKSRLSITAGASARRKTVLVAGDAAALGPRLEAWAAGVGG
ncbi:MAG TPA: DUF167 domain-containing protein [Rhodospirillales bacterium]|nr:DUF167 domain-containing protein [Rhodospirillales bacterium]HJO68455.1 DUF167 domain-containing protein [Rhodospirillales bacterium]